MLQNKDLKHMFFHNFFGTIADNLVELNWFLVMVYYWDKLYAAKALTLFAVSDSIWVVLSSIYYAVITAFSALLPKARVQDPNADSKMLKSAYYLIYIVLTPIILFVTMFNDPLMSLMGVTDLDFYRPYMYLCYLSIWLVCPSCILLPTYYRSILRTKTAAILDHAVTWTMLSGTLIAVYILNTGVVGMMVANIIANAIPLIYFLWDKPLNRQSGWEFSLKTIRELYQLAKWEYIRKLSPRLAAVFTTGSLLLISPAYAAAKYILSNVFMFFEGFVDASAGLAIVDSSRNVGLNISSKKAYKSSNYLWKLAFITFLIVYILLYTTSSYWLHIFTVDQETFNLIHNPIIWFLFVFELLSKLRYYIILSICRTRRTDLNSNSQIIYAIITSIVTPLGIILFLNIFDLQLVGVFLTGAIVGTLQWLFTEIYVSTNGLSLGY